MNKKLSSFNYKIVRKKRKTIGIKVTNKGDVIITSPFGISEEMLENIVKKKSQWILNKLDKFKNENIEAETSLKNGYKLLYLGIELKLELNYKKENNSDFSIVDGKFKVFFQHNIDLEETLIKNHITKIYKREAEKILMERTKIYMEIMDVHPLKITIKSQKAIWGSCSFKKNINYNYKIVMAPMEIVDYIVVHELSHLIHMNHSKQYWNTVKNILPDYKVRSQWLKENGFKIMKILE
jgi:predicted metal-dependent hydrolase